MIKRVLIISTAAMMLSACAASEVEDTSAVDAFKAALEKQNNACAERTLVQSKAKIAEATTLRADGNNSEAKDAEDAAMEAYKTESLAYNQAMDANEAQAARVNELTARRDAIAANANAVDSKKWAESVATMDAHIASAQEAYDMCDTEKAALELDAVSAILDLWEDVIAEASAKGMKSGESYMYTVKKGDNLWEIAGVEYKNPFMWPVIYWANKQNIEDPDLIFPGQNFEIVFDYTEKEMADAENLAKTRGSWSLYDNK